MDGFNWQDSLLRALSGSAKDFLEPQGSSIVDRTAAFESWYEDRVKNNTWSYSRTILGAPTSRLSILDEAGNEYRGVNFGSQDYLNLSSDEEVKEAAIRAIRDHGVHSSGSSILMGNTSFSKALEATISDFLGMSDTVLFPTGWAAGYGAIQGLIRRNDHVVIDVFAHNCLQSGARSATKNVRTFPHLDNGRVRDILNAIRADDAKNAILVVTESLFSMHADTPAIAELQAICHEFDAVLLVDVAHDLGCLGASGRGLIEDQGMVGKVDLIMGSFSKSFASNGGFVASKSKSIRDYLRVYAAPALFSNALSPSQSASVLKAIEIIDSDRGTELRNDLMAIIKVTRTLLSAAGLDVHGVPSAIIPVAVGDEAVGRLVAGILPSKGVFANLAEYPSVPKGDARLRLQMMSSHTQADVELLRNSLVSAITEAKQRNLL